MNLFPLVYKLSLGRLTLLAAEVVREVLGNIWDFLFLMFSEKYLRCLLSRIGFNILRHSTCFWDKVNMQLIKT